MTDRPTEPPITAGDWVAWRDQRGQERRGRVVRISQINSGRPWVMATPELKSGRMGKSQPAWNWRRLHPQPGSEDG